MSSRLRRRHHHAPPGAPLSFVWRSLMCLPVLVMSYTRQEMGEDNGCIPNGPSCRWFFAVFTPKLDMSTSPFGFLCHAERWMSENCFLEIILRGNLLKVCVWNKLFFFVQWSVTLCIEKVSFYCHTAHVYEGICTLTSKGKITGLHMI